MTDPVKVEYFQLTVGFEFPPRVCTIEAGQVDSYLKATGDFSDLYRGSKLVPPMAVTAYAMTSLSQAVVLPSGTIHVSQELAFIRPVKIGDTITCCSKVSRKIDRGGLRLMNIDVSVVNQNAETVLTGKVGFVLP